MKDWSSLARAAGLAIPDKDLAQITPTLNALEESFRPLARALTPAMEPCAVFLADDEENA